MKNWLPLFILALFLYSCTPAKVLSRSAQEAVISNGALINAHIGISVYEPATNKWWYNYGGDKYFVPASNTKIPTCYAAMKYLGDSLVGLRYEKQNDAINFVGTGDPTFLHPDFKIHPVYNFLKSSAQVNYLLDGTLPGFTPLGNGWAWNDYGNDYAPERSEMPLYGNVAKFFMQGDTVAVSPSFFYNSNLNYTNSVLKNGAGPWFTMERPVDNNLFHALHSSSMYRTKTIFSSQQVPFKTNVNPTGLFKDQLLIKLLEDTLHKKIGDWSYVDAKPVLPNVIHSQPTDSFLKMMMHRSDNFFAEQSLLMVSNERLGVMSDAKIIDTLLKADLRDLPQKPRWVDGSGLSRYNLFTPKDFVFILNKMKTEFGMERLKEILPTGNDGTLSNYYKSDSTYIFAKTGTLSGVVALSGFLYTQKNKLLIFSVLVNNHQASAMEVRRAVEKFLVGIRSKY